MKSKLNDVRAGILSVLLVAGWGGDIVLAQSAPTESPAVASQPGSDGRIETRLKLAEMLLVTHRYDEATAEFNRILQDDPANAEARYGLARVHFWNGRANEARKMLEPAINESTRAEIKSLWNEILTASGDVKAALQAGERALQATPGDPMLEHRQANLQVAAGCFGPAIETLKKLHQADPENPSIVLDLAHAYFTADAYPEAMDLATSQFNAAGDIALRARLAAARTDLRSRHIPEATELLEAVRNADAAEPRAWLGLITCKILSPISSPVDIEECIKGLEQGAALERLRQQDAAREWLFALVAELVSHLRDDERANLATRLSEFLGTADDRPATKICREALDQFAKDGPLAVNPDTKELTEQAKQGNVARGSLLEAANLLLLLYASDQVQELCQAMLERDAEDVQARLIYAESLAVTAKYKEAEEQYQKIVELMPTCTKAERGLARTYTWHREFPKSQKIYEHLIELHPSDMVIRRELARSQGWDKQIWRSLDTYDDAIEELGESPVEEIWHSRLKTERDAKKANWWVRDREAVKLYKRLLDDEDADQEHKFDLAQVYARNRLWEEAAEQYLSILNLDARHRRARDALYKNGLYHRPEMTNEFEHYRAKGRGGLADMDSFRLTNIVKQEIARRTDLSVINTQYWHHFDNFGGGRLDENLTAFRLDERFSLSTYGHVTSGWSTVGESDDHRRWVADASISHKFVDWLESTVGVERKPWRQNRATMVQGMDQNRFYLRLFSNVDPWLDLFGEYGYSGIEGGEFQVDRNTRLDSDHNIFQEFNWGGEYRFTLFPKILKLEYRGFAWFYDKEVPTYFSPDQFVINQCRLAWRHYLNNDQYVEMKKMYYEVGLTGAVDSDGVLGGGYNCEAGWDICHHFGFAVKWDSFRSSTWDSDVFWLQLVSRY